MPTAFHPNTDRELSSADIESGLGLRCPACDKPVTSLHYVQDATITYPLVHLNGEWRAWTPSINDLDEAECYALPCNCTLSHEDRDVVFMAIEQRGGFRITPTY